MKRFIGLILLGPAYLLLNSPALCDWDQDSRCGSPTQGGGTIQCSGATCTSQGQGKGEDWWCDLGTGQGDPEGPEDYYCDCVVGSCGSAFPGPAPNLQVGLNRVGGPPNSPPTQAGNLWSITGGAHELRNTYSPAAPITPGSEVVNVPSFSATIRMTGQVSPGIYGFVVQSFSAQSPSIPSVAFGGAQTGTNLASAAKPGSGTIELATGQFQGTFQSYLTNSFFPPSSPVGVRIQVSGTLQFNQLSGSIRYTAVGWVAAPNPS